jgi:Na+/H+-dicarboxylate symporter
VFGLGAVVGAKLGGAAAAALLLFFAVSIIAYSVLTLVLYPLAPLGGVSIGRFARGILPAQLVAFASRSSLASLPSMLTAARGPLGVSESVSAFVLPLAAATFKLQGAVSLLLGVTFVATLYGIPLGPAAIALAAGYGVLLALSTPGITSAGLLMQVPLFEALGLPVEGLALLIAIDTIPDIFKTVANVTADLLAAVLLDRSKA